MAKDPAFPFYAGDFLAGSGALSMEERGIYITLLAQQWVMGERIPVERLGFLVGFQWDELSEFLRDKFEEFQEEGKRFIYNERLKEERLKRQAFKEKQRANGRKGGRPSKASENPEETQNKTQTQSQKKPLENENENEIYKDGGVGEGIITAEQAHLHMKDPDQFTIREKYKKILITFTKIMPTNQQLDQVIDAFFLMISDSAEGNHWRFNQFHEHFCNWAKNNGSRLLGKNFNGAASTTGGRVPSNSTKAHKPYHEQ